MLILCGVQHNFLYKIAETYFNKTMNLNLFSLYLLMTNNIQNLRGHLILPSCRAGATVLTFPLFSFTSRNWGLQHFSSQWIRIILFSANPFSDHTGSQKRRIKSLCFLKRRKECAALDYLFGLIGQQGNNFVQSFNAFSNQNIPFFFLN